MRNKPAPKLIRRCVNAGMGEPLNGYTNRGCRCAICRAANVKYNKKARERRSQMEIPEDRHGIYTTYVNYSCRCDLCRKANTDYARGRREAK